jgi:beta-xylosidase
VTARKKQPPAAVPSPQPERFPAPAGAPDAPGYRDPRRPADERARDLLARMTLEEKAAQMVCVWNGKADTLVDATGTFDPAKAAAAFADGHGLGQVGRPSDAGGPPGLTARRNAELTNAVQRFFLEHTRLGIPVVFHEECLHGHAARDATSFGQPIGLAATFDPGLVESLYTMAALEARVRGTHQALTPVVDVAREPRWGRVEETFGEDPYLAARMGVAAVRGFQGDATFKDKTRVIATLKHFAAHGLPESGLNCAPAEVSPHTLRDVVLVPFRAAIREAGALSVMPSYNEVDGVPSHANRWLLTDVLRGEWGFKGFTVSDYYAIWEMADRPDTHGHHVAADKKAAAALAVRAGVNIELPEPDCYRHLVELVREGTLRETDLDALVEPMLRAKFLLGLFDDPYVDPDEAERVVGCEAHRDLALRAARETITLLKNEDGLLPLDPAKLRTLAVIGPNAAREMLGGYSGTPKRVVTVLEGIRAAVGGRVDVRYAEGCRITIGGSWTEDRVVPADPAEDRRQIAEAVEVARSADAVVLVIGDNEQTSREGWSKVHLGDRATLDLVGRQEELAEALVATGRPVVVVLFSGRPASIRWLAEHAPAILECWYLGQEGGTAVAEVLFGAVNPGGKLPITFPRSAGHLPAFYNYKPSARRGYLFDDVTPLWPFGFGLSYTTFAVGRVRVADAVIRPDGRTRVTAEVTNTGGRAGTEVVQLYVRDRVSSVTRPVKELRGFARVALRPGETATVAFDVGPEALAFHDPAMHEVVEPGEFALMVGTSSRDEDLTTVTLTVEG